MDEIGLTLVARYCLDDATRFWGSVEDPPEHNFPLGEMILYLGENLAAQFYDVEPRNLEKRARAIVELISDPGQNEKYIRKMASELQIKCINSGKQNLAAGIGEAMSLISASETRKINLEKREELKKRMAKVLLDDDTE
jgi:hypothetical protein